MSPFPALPESEKALIDAIFSVIERADRNEKWTAGLVLLADVLLRLDELSQARTIAGLTAELRAVCTGIKQIQENGVSPNDPRVLQ